MNFDYYELINLIDARIANALDKYVEGMQAAHREAMNEVTLWLRG